MSNTEQQAAIAADYAAGINFLAIRRKYRCSSGTVRDAVEAHGIKPRGYGWKPDQPERLAAIAEDYRAGMPVREIRKKHRCSEEETIRALRAHGVPRRSEADSDPLVEQLVRAGKSMNEIRREAKVSWHRIDRVCRAIGMRPVDTRGKNKPAPRKPKAIAVENRQKAKRIVPVSSMVSSEPTREDYARLCEKEFATPHWLRKAPAMLARIEANEALNRARLRKVKARRARKAAAS